MASRTLKKTERVRRRGRWIGDPGKEMVLPAKLSPHARHPRKFRHDVAEWIVFAEYRGTPDERDDVCTTLVGRRSAGSGYDFVRGVRDLNWEFGDERIARHVASVLSWVRGVRVRISGPQDHTPRSFGTADGRSMQARRARKTKR